jgi:hypothetical protein
MKYGCEAGVLGNPAALSVVPGVRPVALRPTLSGGLPFSNNNPIGSISVKL